MKKYHMHTLCIFSFTLSQIRKSIQLLKFRYLHNYESKGERIHFPTFHNNYLWMTKYYISYTVRGRMIAWQRLIFDVQASRIFLIILDSDNVRATSGLPAFAYFHCTYYSAIDHNIICFSDTFHSFSLCLCWLANHISEKQN